MLASCLVSVAGDAVIVLIIIACTCYVIQWMADKH